MPWRAGSRILKLFSLFSVPLKRSRKSRKIEVGPIKSQRPLHSSTKASYNYISSSRRSIKNIFFCLPTKYEKKKHISRKKNWKFFTTTGDFCVSVYHCDIFISNNFYKCKKGWESPFGGVESTFRSMYCSRLERQHGFHGASAAARRAAAKRGVLASQLETAN